LTAELPKSSASKLFHEKVHYWQLVSYPLMQSRFLLTLQRLKKRIATRGGRSDLVGGHPCFAATDNDLEKCLRVADGDIDWHDIQPHEVRSFDCILKDPFTYQLFFLLPPDPKTGESRPAYGAALGFGSSHQLVHIPFTARALFESAAYINELLFAGREIPEPGELDADDAKLYLGAWEYWRRLHGPNYAKKRDLAVAFLVAVDIAGMADLTAGEEEVGDPDYFFERVSIPYRFGKLAYRLRNRPPLVLHDGGIASAVERFQTDVCDWCAWPAVDQVAKQTVVYLTRVLLANYSPTIEPTSENVSVAEHLMRTPISELAETPTELHPAWKLIRNARAERHLVGMNVLALMVNASELRSSHPAMLATPFAHESELSFHLPSPIVLYEGQYYFEPQKTMAVSQVEVFSLMPGELAEDCIQLLALATLRDDNRPPKCGFLAQAVECAYITCGLGCPYSLLSAYQKAERCCLGLGDWCHWTYATTRLQIGLVPRMSGATEPLDDIGPTRGLFVGLVNGERYLDAVAVFVDMVSRKPSWAEYHLNAIHDCEDKNASLANAFRCSAEIGSSPALMWYGCGLCLQAIEDHSPASEAFRRGIEADPQFAPLRYALGTALYSMGRREESLDYHREALALDPSLAEAHFALGMTQLGLGDEESARRHLRAYVLLDRPYNARYVAVAHQVLQSLTGGHSQDPSLI
jgi:hypothetical protein